jgi:hypothetical protein
VLSLRVSKLSRDQFGNGIKPGANEIVAFWLANSGTGVDLRIKLDRPIARFDEPASRVIRFDDDKGNDLMRPPGGPLVDTFFPANKPIVVKPGPGADEAEVILRGYGTPAPGATKVRIHAALVFLAGSGERIAERKGLEPTPGTGATIGPLRLRFKDPQEARLLGRPLPPPGGGPGRRPIAFDYERPDRSIQSVACLNPEGEQVAVMEGSDAPPGRKTRGFLGSACLSPTTLAPKGSVRAHHEDRSPWTNEVSLDSVEPHRVNPNDLGGTLGAMPAEWSATSRDVATRSPFPEGTDPFSPQPAEHPIAEEPDHGTAVHPRFPIVLSRINGGNRRRNPPNHGLSTWPR